MTPTLADLLWNDIPAGNDICPKCQGTGIGDPLSEIDRKWSWNKNKTHHACHNCGAQTMSNKALGYTKIDPRTGKGCLHAFLGRQAGNCYTVYHCMRCDYTYDIDSGD